MQAVLSEAGRYSGSASLFTAEYYLAYSSVPRVCFPRRSLMVTLLFTVCNLLYESMLP